MEHGTECRNFIINRCHETSYERACFERIRIFSIFAKDVQVDEMVMQKKNEMRQMDLFIFMDKGNMRSRIRTRT